MSDWLPMLMLIAETRPALCNVYYLLSDADLPIYGPAGGKGLHVLAFSIGREPITLET